jgi:hypothetical protein
MNRKTNIIWKDGIPCINLDEPIIEIVKFDIFIPLPKSFIDLQNLKERKNLQDILKDLEKLFKGE